MCKVSVVIPNFNGIAYLKECLDALEQQDFQDFETILVDNGSKDESISMVEREYPRVRILPLYHNYGFCKAVNQGIKAAKGKYVLLLNNDTRAEKEFVGELYRGIAHKKNVFSCQAKLLQMHDPSKMDDGGNYYCALGWAFAVGKGKPAEEYDREKKIFAACGGAAIYCRQAFDEIGYFDERHFAYLEDMDIGYRARIFGYENYYVPKAVVHHVGSGTSGSRYNQFKIRFSSRNNVYLIYKNMPLIQLILNAPLLLTGFFIKIVFFAAKGFGMEYVRGLTNGVVMAFQGKKVRFSRKNLKNYGKIQLQLWANIWHKMADR